MRKTVRDENERKKGHGKIMKEHAGGRRRWR